MECPICLAFTIMLHLIIHIVLLDFCQVSMKVFSVSGSPNFTDLSTILPDENLIFFLLNSLPLVKKKKKLK